ncbi:AEC family transporter [Actinomyces israelii]|uniref:AEC family transporter n=1 Tax=Actinomyces israelii TaxID=1659 RepID=UPI0005BB2819|nr:AEC family transporter [Actinomyces israelii]
MGGVIGGLAVFAAVIGVGWLLVRTGAVPRNADAVLTRVCFFAATPALLVCTLADADLGAVAGTGTLVALAAESAAILSAWVLHRLLLHRTTAEATIGALASGYVNAANLGIPVLVLVLGDAAPIAPVLLLQLLVITPAAFVILDTVTRRGSPSRLATFTIPLRNPLLLAVAAGAAVNLSGADLDGVAGGRLREALDTLGRIAVPLMMLSLGMSLAASRMRAPLADDAPASPPEPAHDAASRVALRWAVGWKLLVAPGLAGLLGLGAGLRGPGLLVPITAAALPTAQNVFMYASRYGVAKPLGRDAVLITTAGFVPVVLLAAAVLG